MASIWRFECVAGKTKFSSFCCCLISNKWVTQQFSCCRPGRWVPLETKSQKILCVRREMFWYLRYILAISNFKYCRNLLIACISVICRKTIFYEKYIPRLRKQLTPSYWLQGGLEVAISRMVHPRLQISTERLQPDPFMMTYIKTNITYTTYGSCSEENSLKVTNEDANLRRHPVWTSFERTY